MNLRLTIIGAGPGGYTAALHAARLGAKVTVIETDNLGGTCLNWGCIPTKTIKATAEALDLARRFKEFGLSSAGEVKPNLPVIMARKDKVIKTLADGISKEFKQLKIELLRGAGTVVSPDLVKLQPPEGQSVEIRGDRLIIATGSKPMNVPAFPFDGRKIISSNDALVMTEIPEELLIIGGGVIGVEFGFIYNEFGSRVTIVEALDRVVGLPSVDPESSRILAREMKKKKIQLYLDKTVLRTENAPGGKVKAVIGPSPFLKEVKEKNRGEIEVTADKVLVCIGREQTAGTLGLEKIGLETDSKGWMVANKKMETNIPGVYAVGDVLGPAKIMLAHVASTEAVVAVENALGGKRTMNYDVVPSGIFTFPELADVGLTEAQAEERGLDYRADSFLFRALGKAQAMGEIVGQAKIVSERKTGRILGAHLIGPHATDLIAEAALAMKLGATLNDLASTIHLHPSLSEIILETAQTALRPRSAP